MGPKKIREFCRIGPEGEKLLEAAVAKLGFSARAFSPGGIPDSMFIVWCGPKPRPKPICFPSLFPGAGWGFKTRPDSWPRPVEKEIPLPVAFGSNGLLVEERNSP